MKINKIELKGFTRHTDTTVQLPAKGVVLVTGVNGRGKSSLVEAVAYAGWKRGLRLTRWAPWTEGQAGSIVLHTDAGTITRSVTADDTHKLAWNPTGLTKPVKYETPTKQQQAMEKVIGDFDIWARACTFSKAYASKAGRFGAATDGERKLLLETILGLDYFDAALKKCRVDIATLVGQETKQAAEVVRLLAAIEADKVRLTDARNDLAAATIPEVPPKPTLSQLPDLPPEPEQTKRVESPEEAKLRAEVVEVSAAVDREGKFITQLAEERVSAASALAVKQSEAQRHAAQHARLCGGECPECEQPITPERMAEIAARATEAREAAATEQARVATRSTEIATLLGEAQQNQKDLQARLTKLRQQIASLTATLDAQHSAAYSAALVERKAVTDRRKLLKDADDAAIRVWEAQRTAAGEAEARQSTLALRQKEVEALLARHQGEHDDAAFLLADTRMAVKTKQAVEFALSPKGFRAHVLAQTLQGIEGCVNAHLVNLGYAGLAVELRPYSEKADGSSADSINLIVRGVEHSYGYPGCSDGEQRRLDIAFLLALMEVSTGALGSPNATLWLDEVFDALDVEGVGAVCSLLSQLAEERAVVVIAHSPTLIDALRPTQALHVEADPDNPRRSRIVTRT